MEDALLTEPLVVVTLHVSDCVVVPVLSHGTIDISLERAYLILIVLECAERLNLYLVRFVELR